MNEIPVEELKADEVDKAGTNSGTPVWMWLLPLLIVPIAVMAWFSAVSQEDHAAKIIKEAAFVAPSELKNYCDTGKVVRTTLYTSENGIGDNKNQFAYLSLDERVQADKRNEQWMKVESNPKVIELFSQEKTVEIKVNDSDLNKKNLPVIFDDIGARRSNCGAPEAWKKLMTHDDNKYVLRALSCSQKVDVAGTFWRTKDGIFVKGFEYTFVGPGKFSSPASVRVARGK